MWGRTNGYFSVSGTFSANFLALSSASFTVLLADIFSGAVWNGTGADEAQTGSAMNDALHGQGGADTVECH
ncbi:MAG: hypothetical protein WBC85_05465 [Planktotalea sp.]